MPIIVNSVSIRKKISLDESIIYLVRHFVFTIFLYSVDNVIHCQDLVFL